MDSSPFNSSFQTAEEKKIKKALGMGRLRGSIRRIQVGFTNKHWVGGWIQFLPKEIKKNV